MNSEVYSKTIFYVAPEILLESPLSTKVDLWSFGAVLFEMTTKKQLMINPNGLICISKAMAINKIYDFSIFKKTKGFKDNNFKERFIKFSNFD